MALPNPGQDMIDSQGGIEAISGTPEVDTVDTAIPAPVNLTLEEMNAKFDKWKKDIRNVEKLAKGDIVKLNDFALDLTHEYSLLPEQKGMVILYGEEAKKITGNVFSDTLVQYITPAGFLDTMAMSSRYLTKIGFVKIEKK